MQATNNPQINPHSVFSTMSTSICKAAAKMPHKATSKISFPSKDHKANTGPLLPHHQITIIYLLIIHLPLLKGGMLDRFLHLHLLLHLLHRCIYSTSNSNKINNNIMHPSIATIVIPNNNNNRITHIFQPTQIIITLITLIIIIKISMIKTEQQTTIIPIHITILPPQHTKEEEMDSHVPTWRSHLRKLMNSCRCLERCFLHDLFSIYF